MVLDLVLFRVRQGGQIVVLLGYRAQRVLNSANV